jgi:glycosyltransferase involved in cell wall biosynthesis
LSNRAPLSAVVITLNAASQLEACLASVGFAQEILVVDSGSTDGTVELAQARGARVVSHQWLGFGRQKQFAVSQAAHDWVLCIDADERVSDGGVEAHERDVGLLDDPVEHGVGRCAREVGDRGEGVQDVPERGQAHEQDSCHSGREPPAPR